MTDNRKDVHVEQKLDLGSFTNNVMTDRVIALLLFATAGALCAWLSHGSALPTAIMAWLGGIGGATLITAACWLIRYRAESVFPAVHALRPELARATKDRETANQVFEEMKARRLRRRTSFTEDGAQLTNREPAFRPTRRNGCATSPRSGVVADNNPANLQSRSWLTH